MKKMANAAGTSGQGVKVKLNTPVAAQKVPGSRGVAPTKNMKASAQTKAGGRVGGTNAKVTVAPRKK
jgi:hypothetical protein